MQSAEPYGGLHLRRLASRLARELSVSVPRKPQHVGEFVLQARAAGLLRAGEAGVSIEEASGSELLRHLPGGGTTVHRQSNILGNEAPWGARSGETRIISVPSAVWRLHDATIVHWHGQNILLDRDRQIVDGISSRWWPLAANLPRFRDLVETAETSLGSAFMASADDPLDNFCHWTVNVLPRLQFAPRGSTIVGAKATLAFQRDSLELLGLRSNWPDIDGLLAIRAREVLVVSAMAEGLRHPAHKGAAWALKGLRSVANAAQEVVNAEATPMRFYVSRQFASRRHLLQEEELALGLERRGVQPLALEQFPFPWQVAAFARSGLVVGIHGAGLSGAAFLEPGSALAEIHGDQYGTPAFRILAGIRKADYFSLVGENVGGRGNNRDDVSVDVPQALDALDTHIFDW